MQRRVRTTIRPDDVLTVEDGDFASLQGQGLILEVLADEQGDGETAAAPTVEVPAQQTAKARGKETGDGQ